ncbi:hypothetical protein EHP00_1330 [Ecytonucleospora hepatopenaei]|uniref:Uncharacterized protein n=1 Tax=Ecytonucleospora hepatopenaei TaxID=646526 RepID=A0A1W0E5C9_9MICR|nr:hypothetical protein EHP00_1330 [Ecytonucleospora hepatopenaei]
MDEGIITKKEKNAFENIFKNIANGATAQNLSVSVTEKPKISVVIVVGVLVFLVLFLLGGIILGLVISKIEREEKKQEEANKRSYHNYNDKPTVIY